MIEHFQNHLFKSLVLIADPSKQFLDLFDFVLVSLHINLLSLLVWELSQHFFLQPSQHQTVADEVVQLFAVLTAVVFD
jgi:hypothetical protein